VSIHGSTLDAAASNACKSHDTSVMDIDTSTTVIHQQC
jgi:hypothetical protein